MLRTIFYEKKTRDLIFQILFVVLVGSLVYEFSSNAARNLKAQGIASGFGFMSETAGFSIIQALIPYSEASTYFDAFLVGLLNTLLVSGLGVAAATGAGFLIGIGRISRNFLISRVCLVYIEMVRNIPLLLQIFFWYFVVLRALPHPRQSYNLVDAFFLNNRGFYVPALNFEPMFYWFWIPFVLFLAGFLFWKRRVEKREFEKNGSVSSKFTVHYAVFAGTGLLAAVFGNSLSFELPFLSGFNFRGGVSIIPEFSALFLSLTIYTAGFIAEIVRSGIESVPKGQLEAAHALGLKQGVILRKIVIPQALRVIIPPLTSQYLNLTKNSSLAAAIGYPELVSVFAGTALNQTGQAVEIIVITMSVYMVISLSISVGMNIYNKKMAIVER